MPKLRFLNEDIDLEVTAGTTIKDAADQRGINLVRGLFPGLHCHGRGLCGRCRVWAMPRAERALGERTFWERLRRYDGARRLACQAPVLGDVEVRTSPNAAPPPQSTVWPADPNARWKRRLAAEDKAAAEKAAAAPAKVEKPAAKTEPPAAEGAPAAASAPEAPTPTKPESPAA